jgi:hypothetical protein
MRRDFPEGELKSDKPEDIRPLSPAGWPILPNKAQMKAECDYDTNGYVPGPQAAFDEYRKRVSCSGEEKRDSSRHSTDTERTSL